jgi:hypothetical protein
MTLYNKYIFKIKVAGVKNPRNLQCGDDAYKTFAPVTVDLTKIDLVREYVVNVIGFDLFDRFFTYRFREEHGYLAGAKALKHADLAKQFGIEIKHYGNNYYVHCSNALYVDKTRIIDRALNFKMEV